MTALEKKKVFASESIDSEEDTFEKHKQKRRLVIESSEESAESDVDIIDVKPSQNTDDVPTHAEENFTGPAEKEVTVLAPGKGMKKVKRTETYVDEKGYFVTREFSDYEEYDLPVKVPVAPVAPPTNQIRKIDLNQNSVAPSKGRAQPKAQGTLSSFFGPK